MLPVRGRYFLECAGKLVKTDEYKSSRDSLKPKDYQRCMMINDTEIQNFLKENWNIDFYKEFKNLREDKKNKRSLKN